MSKKKNEIVLTGTSSKIAGVFDPIDFEKLNESITKLAESSSKLTSDEKKFAIDIIEEWDKSVIRAIDDKIKEGRGIIATLDPDSTYIYDKMDDELFEALANQISSKTASLYKEYIKKKEELFELQKDSPKVDLTRDINETAGEYTDRTSKEMANAAKYDLKIAKARNKAEWALLELKNELSHTPEVQEIIKRINTFVRKSSNFKKNCDEKSRLAKINITISDTNAKEALKEIMSFKI